MSWLAEEHSKLAALIGASAAGGLLVGTAKYTIQRRPGGFWGWLCCGAASTLVAVLVGLALDGSGLPPGQQWAIVGVCSYVAEDLLVGALTLAATVRSDPLGALARVFSALRGRGATAAPGAPDSHIDAK